MTVVCTKTNLGWKGLRYCQNTVGGNKAFFGETVTNNSLFHSIVMQLRTSVSDVALEWFVRLIHVHEFTSRSAEWLYLLRPSVLSISTFRQKLKRKGKPVPVQAYYILRGFQEVEAPRLQDSQHMKVVRL